MYASLCLIQSLERDQPFSGCLTAEAEGALKEWSCRRSRDAQRQKESQQSQVLFQTFLLYIIIGAHHGYGVCGLAPYAALSQVFVKLIDVPFRNSSLLCTETVLWDITQCTVSKLYNMKDK